MKTASILKLSDLGNDSSKIIKNDIKNKDENISFESALSVFDLLLYIITGEELESNDVNNQNHGKVNLEEGKDLGVDLNFFRSIMSNIDNGEIQVLAKLLADDGYVIQNKFIQAFENELIEQDGGDAIKIEELLERIETDTDHIPSSDFVVDKQQKSIDVASRMLEFSQVLQNTDDSRVNREVKFTANTDTQRLEGQAKSEKIELPTSKSYNEESDLNVKIEQNRQNKAKPYEINNEDYGTLKKDEYNENHVQTKKDLIDIISQKQNDKFNNNLVIQDTSIYTPLGKMGNILQGNTS
ncbi:MAG: hypothetical protein PHP06_07650, partial [Clostridia bacterium]|nr:hypothetical protein [Clostridia bacterium]